VEISKHFVIEIKRLAIKPEEHRRRVNSRLSFVKPAGHLFDICRPFLNNLAHRFCSIEKVIDLEVFGLVCHQPIKEVVKQISILCALTFEVRRNLIQRILPIFVIFWANTQSVRNSIIFILVFVLLLCHFYK